MALETDKKDLEAAQKNEFVIVEIYNIELNDSRILYLTSNNKNVTWANNTYIAFPLRRARASQESSQVVNAVQITLGDKDNIFTKEILSNLTIIKNAFVTIFQQRQSIDGTIQVGFRQIFRGKIKGIDGAIGIINFTLIAPFSDPQRPVNDKKFGEFPGMIDVFRRISA